MSETLMRPVEVSHDDDVRQTAAWFVYIVAADSAVTAEPFRESELSASVRGRQTARPLLGVN
jgi:hypothetical protein